MGGGGVASVVSVAVRSALSRADQFGGLARGMEVNFVSLGGVVDRFPGAVYVYRVFSLCLSRVRVSAVVSLGVAPSSVRFVDPRGLLRLNLCRTLCSNLTTWFGSGYSPALMYLMVITSTVASASGRRVVTSSSTRLLFSVWRVSDMWLPFIVMLSIDGVPKIRVVLMVFVLIASHLC